MKKQVILAVLLLWGISASAQTEEKKLKITKKSEATYTVAADGETKEGIFYVKNLDNDGVWMQGRYKDNKRVGTWYMFDAQAKSSMRYNYDQKKLLYLDTASFHNVSVRVVTEDKKAAADGSIPFPICPIDYYSALITNRLNTSYADPALDGLASEVTAHIGADGETRYTITYIKDEQAFKTMKFDLKTPLEIDWIPSYYNGKPVDSEFTLYVNNTADTGNFRKFRWHN